MLLNNFRRVLVNTISRSLGISQTEGMTGEIKTTGGTVYEPVSKTYIDTPQISGLSNYCGICTGAGNYDSTSIPTSSSLSFERCLIYLGTGNVTPTIDDYKLSGELVTGLTSQQQSTTANNNSITFSAIATNNTESPVTIKEIGLAGYRAGTAGFVVLLTRDVLPTPVTLNVGDSKRFSITIDFRSLTDTTVNE